MKIEWEGDMYGSYSFRLRTYFNWCKDGEFAGNENDGAKRVSAVEVRVVKIH